jgi:hypothetical protein
MHRRLLILIDNLERKATARHRLVVFDKEFDFQWLTKTMHAIRIGS